MSEHATAKYYDDQFFDKPGLVRNNEYVDLNNHSVTNRSQNTLNSEKLMIIMLQTIFILIHYLKAMETDEICHKHLISKTSKDTDFDNIGLTNLDTSLLIEIQLQIKIYQTKNRLRTQLKHVLFSDLIKHCKTFSKYPLKTLIINLPNMIEYK